MARLTASDYYQQLRKEGKTDAQASAQVAAVMEHRASEDTASNPAAAKIETQKAANYNARARGGSGGSASPGTAPAAPTNPYDPTDPNSPAFKSAYDLAAQMLTSWGLGSLVPQLKSLIEQGYTADTLAFALQNTPQYQQRFSANTARKALGLAVLSPAEYIAAEEQYRNVLASNGLPAGFYDSQQDLDKFIATDVSPAELQDRAQVAHDQYINAPQATKDLWSSYGFSNGDAIAAILDPSVATQVIKDRAAQVAIGGAAAQSGFALSQPRAQQFTQAGVTLAGARQAYQQLAQALPTDTQIAHRFGTSEDQTQEENALVLGQAPAQVKITRLQQQERALFAGNPGLGAPSLGVAQPT